MSAREKTTGGEARPFGLPGPLPEGERILWQGQPEWRSLAWRAFHVREVSIYFAAFAIWRAASGLAETGSALMAVERASMVAPFAAVSIALLGLLAYLTARYAVYTLTDRRVVLSTGVALSSTLNLPLKSLASADLKVNRDGTGDLALGLGDGQRVAYAGLWPHARPWRVKSPEPSLRAIADPTRVAGLLADAIQPGAGARIAQARTEAPETGRAPAAALAS